MTTTANVFGAFLTQEEHQRLQSTARRRLNVGCGEHPLRYWTNLDEAPDAVADLYMRVPPLPCDDASLDEIYAGHFLEHLSPEDAGRFLDECHRCLVPGGRLGIVVPDTKLIFSRYLRGDIDEVEYPAGTWRCVSDLDEICALFLYSTVQDSPHLWMYDDVTLKRILERHGFTVTGKIDRFKDPRIPVGAWYQMGYQAEKPQN